jgi:hypothetical protein
MLNDLNNTQEPVMIALLKEISLWKENISLYDEIDFNRKKIWKILVESTLLTDDELDKLLIKQKELKDEGYEFCLWELFYAKMKHKYNLDLRSYFRDLCKIKLRLDTLII